MLKAGLVSISFRNLAVPEIIKLAQEAGLAAIEWGSDVHVKANDLKWAAEVRKMTQAAGLAVSSLGSYYRVGDRLADEPEFSAELASAVELGAPVIRVWAGRQPSAKASPAYRQAVVEDSRRIARLAAKAGVRVAFEYHANTLTDESASALDLLRQAGDENLFSYWQPPTDLAETKILAGLQEISPWLSHVHVFHWVNKKRRPLAEGVARWQQYFSKIARLPGERYALLEFVKDDQPAQLLQDAAALLGLLEDI